MTNKTEMWLENVKNHHPICKFNYVRCMEKHTDWRCECNMLNEYDKSQEPSGDVSVGEIEKAINPQKFLIENGLGDLILNDRDMRRPEEPIYVSDALKLYAHAIHALLPKRLSKENEYKVQLEAWQEAFGTTQLTHALDRLKSAEKYGLSKEEVLREFDEKFVCYSNNGNGRTLYIKNQKHIRGWLSEILTPAVVREKDAPAKDKEMNDV